MARRAAVLGLILALLGWVAWVYVNKALCIASLAGETEALRRRGAELSARIAELEHLLGRLEDPEYLELWARRVLLYGYPGEVLVIFKGG